MSEVDCRLSTAVVLNDATAAQQAIRDGVNVNVVCYNTTPLWVACSHGYDQIIRIYLDAGADAWWKNFRGGSAIVEACSNGHLSTVKLLINHDTRLLEIVDNFGWTPLIVAIDRQQSDIVRFLLDCGADANCVVHKGITALMHACQEGKNIEIVRLLLAAGADVEARDKKQQTALHYAARRGDIEVVRELVLQHNANMCAVDGEGQTPFDLACRSWRSHAAVHPLLEMYGKKLIQDHGRLALHELLKVAQYSFAEGEEFHPPLNPLQIVLPLGKLRLKRLRTLLHTLDPELIRNRDDTGKLPIHIACQTNSPLEVLALILELNPSAIRIADYAGALPIHLLCATDASVRFFIQSFPGSVAVPTNTGDYPFMVVASDSSSASLSVVYELVRADPGMIQIVPTNPVSTDPGLIQIMPTNPVSADPGLYKSRRPKRAKVAVLKLCCSWWPRVLTWKRVMKSH